MVVLGDFGLAISLFEDEEDDENALTISNKPTSRIHTTGVHFNFFLNENLPTFLL